MLTFFFLSLSLVKDQFVSEFPVGLHEDIYEPMPILIVNLIEVIQVT